MVPGFSLQERPQGIVHMKIATICPLQPAPGDAGADCSSVGEGDLLRQGWNPGAGPGPSAPPTHRGTSVKGGFALGRLVSVPSNPPHTHTRGKAPAECPRRRLTSLHTNIVPNTTCRPSKKLSPMMITVAPPVVQPSLGLMALMHGVAAHTRQRRQASAPGRPRQHSPTSGRPGAAGGEAGHASGRHAKGDRRSAC